MAVWAEGKLCPPLSPLNSGNHCPKVLHTEPSKPKLVRPGAKDEHFQQVGHPAAAKAQVTTPGDGPTPGGIELMQHQQHQQHPQPVAERLEHVEIAEVGVDGLVEVGLAGVPTLERPGDRQIDRQGEPRGQAPAAEAAKIPGFLAFIGKMVLAEARDGLDCACWR